MCWSQLFYLNLYNLFSSGFSLELSPSFEKIISASLHKDPLLTAKLNHKVKQNEYKYRIEQYRSHKTMEFISTCVDMSDRKRLLKRCHSKSVKNDIHYKFSIFDFSYEQIWGCGCGRGGCLDLIFMSVTLNHTHTLTLTNPPIRTPTPYPIKWFRVKSLNQTNSKLLQIIWLSYYY